MVKNPIIYYCIIILIFCRPPNYKLLIPKTKPFKFRSSKYKKLLNPFKSRIVIAINFINSSFRQVKRYLKSVIFAVFGWKYWPALNSGFPFQFERPRVYIKPNLNSVIKTDCGWQQDSLNRVN